MANTDDYAGAPENRLWRSVWFQRWLNRRLPPANAVVLNQSNIFILPTRQGIYFLVLLFFMVLAAINYQNSLIFGLAFLLLSFFMVSILHTFGNLSGLTVQAGTARAAFAGEDASFSVRLSRQGERHHEAIVLGWDPERLIGADLIEAEAAQTRLFVQSKRRGPVKSRSVVDPDPLPCWLVSRLVVGRSGYGCGHLSATSVCRRLTHCYRCKPWR